MTSQIGITVTAAFIADRIARSLADKTSQARIPCTASADVGIPPSPDELLLREYLQCMGAAWSHKRNLYAFRRVLSECGYQKPASTDEIYAAWNTIADRLTLRGLNEVEIDLDEYAKRNSDSVEALSKKVGELRRALIDARDGEIIRSAESAIRQHAATLRRKRKQFISQDDYGIQDTTRWDQEIGYFFERVVLPAIESYDIPEHLLSGIADMIEQIAAEDGQSVTDYSPGRIEELSPQEFEIICAEILRKQGWNTRLTKASGDQGVDIVAERGGLTVVVQCKMYASSVGNSAVQEVYSGKNFLGADVAVVVSTAEFTASARELANGLDVFLLHYSQLEHFDRMLFFRERTLKQ